MLRIIGATIRHRPGRTAAQVIGIMLATMSFALLTATAQRSTVDVTGTVEAANRPAYDILVRPKGAKLALERGSGLVEPGYLSGIYGGITLEQWHTIAEIPGVGAAAPVAMLGYGTPSLPVTVDLGPAATGHSGRQVLRVDVSWTSDRGLTSVAGQPTQYLYATDRPLEGTEYNLSEITADGDARPVCQDSGRVDKRPDALLHCWSARSGPGTPTVSFGWTFPYLIAAVDPVEEAKLARLDAAVVSGRYFDSSDTVDSRTAALPGPGGREATWTEIPVLVAAKPQVDRQLSYRIVRLTPAAAESVARGATAADLHDERGSVVSTGHIDIDAAYQRFLDRFEDNDNIFDRLLPEFFSTGALSYRDGPGGDVVPEPRKINRSAVWGDFGQRGVEGFADMPEEAADPIFRPIEAHRALSDDSSERRSSLLLDAVGRFDVTRLPAWSQLSAVPMQTYFAAGADPGDEAARSALGSRSLMPTANFGGFLGQAPSMLTTLDAIPSFLDDKRFSDVDPAWAKAPLSVVRVRLDGQLGLDAVSRERIRLVAEQIAARTGLDVDIMVGSSPTSVPVELSAGSHGRPALSLSQHWAKKGVAVSIIEAIDRKSLLLFALILVVCALFVANATAAAVRSRRVDLAVLACLGWSRRRLFSLIVVESATYGLMASLLGAAAAIPAASLLNVRLNAWWLLATVPLTAALATAASLTPARQASRSDPASAIRPSVVFSGRARAPRSLAGLALTNALRSPGRTILGAASLAIGVCSLTLLAAIGLAFQGAVVGTLLGDAVSLQAQAGDYIAAAMIAALGASCVADVVFVNVRERAAEFAALRATGWRERELARVVCYETVLIGVAGAVPGAAGAIILLAAFTGGVTGAVWQVAAAVAAAGIVVTGLASALPLAAVYRLPTPRLLGEA